MGPHEFSASVEELSPSQCWEIFREADFGRLAVVIADHPELFPINYVVDHGTVVFRTAPGTKLDGALSGAPVAFEVDGFSPSTGQAWSAVLKGRAERMTSIEDVPTSALLPLFPWQGGEKNNFIRIVPGEISGRRFTVPPSVRRGPGLGDSHRFQVE
ncbi:pyridoxamine 5'-phosphate oxidase family protein [Arthrobacter mobilis]|uniref:Pyridoxamine 5'-phosphate oxidase family protein n=1 Tax=Arthrobacter mobilis TaxID=2724944 RepID=A0A7X6HDS1_9MICC|nr:pyridoxamine 5'-phosphate oxidase family protein [Arthrobacter mobilis]NKX55258.1 pyridoxamine 5'-phosphate oxidase family protein [Arthrobacter mobilis]